MTDIRIGISGWRYPRWRGVFYPEGLAQKRELEYASRQFNSVEINGSFYSLQRPEYYRQWAADTPDDFLFAVKGPRFITHMKKLKEVEAPLANFFASGVLALEHKLGPILWQFPAMMPFTRERFVRFFDLLPRSAQAAAALATGHDARLNGRTYIPAAPAPARLRHAVEVRSLTCCSSDFVQLLRERDIGLVVADTAGRWPYLEDVTSDFVYVRLHGDTELYTSGYSPAAIDHWAERVRLWSSGDEPANAVTAAPRLTRSTPRDVYVYFDNDAKVHAPFDAIALSRAVGLSRGEATDLAPQSSARPKRQRAAKRSARG